MTNTELYTGLGIAVATGLIVLLFRNRLTDESRRRHDREAREHSAEDARQARKQTFLAFMEMWKTDIRDRYAHNEPFINKYFGRLVDFQEQMVLIRDDFGTRKAEFERLCAIASGFKRAQEAGERQPDKDKILAAFDALIRFTHDT